MAEGYLLVPTPLDKPIRLLDVDMTTTNNWIKEQTKRRNQNIISDGLIDPDLADGIISNSTNQGFIKCSAIPKGFFQDGNFAKSIAEQEFPVTSGDNIYFVYALAKETDTIVTYPEDEFTPDHTYRDYTLDLLFSTTEDSSLGDRIGKIQQSGVSITILDTNRDLAKIEFNMVGGSPDISKLDLLPAFNQSQFKKNPSMEIEVKPEAPFLSPIASIQAWHKTFAQKSTGANDSTGANKLIDSTATFQTDGVQVGMIVYNQTDALWSYVTAVDSETDLTLNEDIFTTTGKTYNVYATLKLSDNWVECNGQTLSDTESPLNGEVIPDLNGDGRFLRGSDVSGIEQADDFKSHDHNINVENNGSPGTLDAVVRASAISGAQTTIITPAGGAETRPINMSVVWIMRIK